MNITLNFTHTYQAEAANYKFHFGSSSALLNKCEAVAPILLTIYMCINCLLGPQCLAMSHRSFCFIYSFLNLEMLSFSVFYKIINKIYTVIYNQCTP